MLVLCTALRISAGYFSKCLIILEFLVATERPMKYVYIQGMVRLVTSYAHCEYCIKDSYYILQQMSIGALVMFSNSGGRADI